MTKKNQTAPNTETVNFATLPITEPDGMEWLATQTVEWNGTSHSVASLPVQALAYLIDYGSGKSEQDCIAGLKGAIDGSGKQAMNADELAKLANDHGIVQEDNEPVGNFLDALFKAESAKRKAERWSRIIDGTIGSRSSGPRRVGIDKIAAEVAIEELKVLCGEKKMTFPTKAADVNAMVAKWLGNESNKTRVYAEAQRRMERAPTVSADAFDELFATS